MGACSDPTERCFDSGPFCLPRSSPGETWGSGVSCWLSIRRLAALDELIQDGERPLFRRLRLQCRRAICGCRRPDTVIHRRSAERPLLPKPAVGKWPLISAANAAIADA